MMRRGLSCLVVLLGLLLVATTAIGAPVQVTGVEFLAAAYTGSSSRSGGASVAGAPRKMLTSWPASCISTSLLSCCEISPRIA